MMPRQGQQRDTAPLESGAGKGDRSRPPLFGHTCLAAILIVSAQLLSIAGAMSAGRVLFKLNLEELEVHFEVDKSSEDK